MNMNNEQNFPQVSGFSTSGMINEDMMRRYNSSILNLKQSIADLKATLYRSKIINKQYTEDIQFCSQFKVKLYHQVQELKQRNHNINRADQILQSQKQQASSFQLPLPPKMPTQKTAIDQQKFELPKLSAITNPPNPPNTQKKAPAPPPQQNNPVSNNREFPYSIISPFSFFNQTTVGIKFIVDVGKAICTIDYSPDGRYFSFSTALNMYVVDSLTGRTAFMAPLAKEAYKDDHSRALKFSPNGQNIAVAIPPTTIGVFSMETHTIIKQLNGHLRNVSALAFTNNSAYLISGGADGVICIWDTATFNLIQKIHYGTQEPSDKVNSETSVVAIAVDKNSNQISIGYTNGDVGIFDFEKWHIQYFKAHEETIISLSYTMTGNLITTSADKLIKVWTIHGEEMKNVKIMDGHRNYVTSSTSSPAVTIAFTGSKDETIKCWNYETGINLFTIEGLTNTVLNLAHHPRENMFISVDGGGYIIIWNYLLPINETN